MAGKSIENMCPDLFFLLEYPPKLLGTVLLHPMQI